MASIDDDPATPEALRGVFDDARELGRAAHLFAITIEGAAAPRAIDEGLLKALGRLSARGDVEACAGSITVLLSGEPTAICVARPVGQPGLAVIGDAVMEAMAESQGSGDVQVAVGMATTLDHGDLTLDDAIAVAAEGLEVARASGASRAVHSELYELTLAARKRNGQVFPLERVQDLDGGYDVPAPEGLDEIIYPPAQDPTQPPAVPEEEFNRVVMEAARTGALAEVDDPFAHGSGAGRPIDGSSALALTNGIAPAPEVIAKLERDSRAEIERLKLELEVLRREPGADTVEAENKRERRIKKLLEQLDKAEAEIARLREEREGDKGVPSKFREVQGLDPSEPNAPVKRTMIDGVFEANQDSPEK